MTDFGFARFGFAAVILAAGESARMGREKALLPLPGTEETFLSANIKRLLPFTQIVIVVAGANAATLQPIAYAQGAFLIENPDPTRGQFSSLHTGLQEVLNRGRDVAVITQVDRLPARPDSIQALLDRFQKVAILPPEERKWAVVPETLDPATGTARHGHPIVAGRELIEAFLKAPLTLSAREVEHANQARIDYLPVNDANVIANLNSPEEYAALGG
ncbi:MAG: NTP transferase domain-containing protein [Acidobacteriales bacterium]|nr:NTP transferase domain-containing protein [Terriglobales bacterium]